MNQAVRLIVLLLVFCCLTSPAVAQDRIFDIYIIKWTSLPSDHIPLATLILADGKPHKFVIDTGSYQSLIDTAVARQMKVPVQTAGNANERKLEYIATSVDIGPGLFSLPRMPLTVFDLGTLHTETSVDGILGLDLLSNFALQFDFAKRELMLILGGKVAGTIYEPKKAQLIPLIYDSATEYWWVESTLSSATQ